MSDSATLGSRSPAHASSTPRRLLLGARLLRWPRAHPLKALALFALAFLGMKVFWPHAAVNYRSAAVDRGEVERTITTSGRLVPRQVVRIGSETSGLVEAVYVDVNQRVTKGQLLAVINPERLVAARKQAESGVGAAQADVGRTDALITRSEADGSRTGAQSDRMASLFDRGFVSRQALEASQADRKTAKADEEAARADASRARSNLERARAQLVDAQTAVSRSRIVAPISGIVISRNVDPGQTLASSFQTPVLFEVVDDLNSSEIQVNVSEADIVAVAPGQRAIVSFDSLGSETIPGVVRQVRPSGKDDGGGAVSYQVIIDIDRRAHRLLPGMSATVDIVVERSTRGMRVPAAALAFVPPKPGASSIPHVESFHVSIGPSSGGGPPVRASKEVISTVSEDEAGPAVWRLDADSPTGLVRVPVELGVRGSDVVEIRRGDLQVGERVATGRTG